MCSSCLISISNSVSLLIFCLTTMCCIGVWFPLLVSTCSGMFFSLCAPLCLRRFISCVCLYTKLSKPLGLCVSGSLCFCARRTSVEDSSNNNNKKMEKLTDITLMSCLIKWWFTNIMIQYSQMYDFSHRNTTFSCNFTTFSPPPSPPCCLFRMDWFTAWTQKPKLFALQYNCDLYNLQCEELQ